MPDITLQQIETFLTVAEHLSFSEASKAMYISQPALSKIILRLEASVGAQLFVRKSHGIALTSEGEYLYCEFLPLMHKINQSLSRVSKLNAVQERTLKIAYHTSYNFQEEKIFFGETLQRYKELYPDVTVMEELYEFKELRDALATGDADLIFSASFAFDDLKFASWRKTSPFDFYILMSVDHPLAASDELPMAELSDETFYFVTRSFTTDNEVKRCAQMGFIPKNIVRLPNFPSVLNAVRQGRGMTFCGNVALTASDIKYFLVPNMPELPFYGIAWRTNDLSVEAQDFVNLLPDA